MNTKGTYANNSGSTLESLVISTLQSKGFKLVYYSEYQRYASKYPSEQVTAKYGEELLLKNVPFITIYNHLGATEFLLVSKKYGLEIRIECKWQQSSGSVDEKFPYVYLNAVEAMPENIIIIVVNGGGAKKGAIQWLKTVAKKKRYIPQSKQDKNILVMTLREFVKWANETFR